MSDKKKRQKPDKSKVFEEASQLLKAEREELAARLLSDETRKELCNFPIPFEIRGKLGLMVPITIYVQDPLVAKRDPELGLQEIEICWEPYLGDGPTNSRVAVVDYNGDTNKLEDPAHWDGKQWTFIGKGKRPLHETPGDFQFHQVNVWAVIMRTLNFYEDTSALGRRISWGFEGNRLIVAPHAGYGENAYYDRESKSLQFYYCGTEDNPIYTCLSHDIIVHETGHAILDGIRPYYNYFCSKQTDAFHEFIADFSALLVALRNNDVRHVVGGITKGNLKKEQIITRLAEEFGKYVTGEKRDYLRSAINSRKMNELRMDQSPHEWSQVLTGAMFDIISEIAANHLQKRDKSVLQALWYAVDRFIRVALQPLDYLPPVDVQFEDYVDAMLRRDQLTNPRDPHNYRGIMRAVFKERRIPCPEDEEELNYPKLYCPNIQYLSTSRAALYHFLDDRREDLYIPRIEDFIVAGVDVSKKVRRARGQLPEEYVIQYVWHEDILLEDAKYGPLAGERIPLYCGGTLVYDELGNLLYWSRKPGTQFRTRISGTKAEEREKAERKEGEKRRERLLEYISACVKSGLTAAFDENGREGPGIRGGLAGRRHGGVMKLATNHQFRHHDYE